MTSRCPVVSIAAMRMTLTLDDDVAAKVRDEMVRTGTTVKEVVNRTLRRGFEAHGEEKRRTPLLARRRPGPRQLAAAFTVEARPMGLRPGLDLDDVGGLLDVLDGPARR